MQLDIAEFPVQMLVHMVSNLLESIIQTNDTLIELEDASLTHFHSRAKPNISIYAYLTRILKFAPFSNEALLSLLVYFDRIALKRQYAVNSLNVHRLLITSVVVASKFTSDVYFQNSRYAKVGGLPLLELNRLELEFLFLCEFKLHIPLEDLQDYGDQLLLFHTRNNETSNSPSPSLMISPIPSPPSKDKQPLTATISIMKTANATDNVDTQSIVSVSKSPSIRTSSVLMMTTNTCDSKTILPDITSSKKRKATYSHPLPLRQKRSCPSPPYSTIDSRNIKTSSIKPLLH